MWARRLLLLITLNAALFLGSLEIALRCFPELIPNAASWNFVHHYQDLLNLVEHEGQQVEGSQTKWIVLGDSFTRGAEVPPHKDWVSLIRRQLSDADKLVNLAVGGASTLEQYLTLVRFFPRPPPAVHTLILNLYENDISDNNQSHIRLAEQGEQPFHNRVNTVINSVKLDHWPKALGFLWLNSYAFKSLFSLAKSTFTPQGRADEDAIKNQLKSMVFLKEARRYVTPSETFKERDPKDLSLENLQTTLNYIDKIKAYCDQHKLQLVVNYFPSFQEVYFKELNQFYGGPEISEFPSYGEALTPHLTSRGVSFLDLTPLFRQKRHEFPIYLELDIHLSMDGHKFAANIVSDWLLHRNATL